VDNDNTYGLWWNIILDYKNNLTKLNFIEIYNNINTNLKFFFEMITQSISPSFENIAMFFLDYKIPQIPILNTNTNSNININQNTNLIQFQFQFQYQ
jgi:hypothetical protein